MELITITGPSGAGKDTVARILSELTGRKVVCSYTTRPMRDGEADGREHYFVSSADVPPHEKMLAFTQYGGYEYWTLAEQFKEPAIYVVDEEGLRSLYRKFPDLTAVRLYVDAHLNVRRKRGVSYDRIVRDECRQTLPDNFYQFRVENDFSDKEALRSHLKRLCNKIK